MCVWGGGVCGVCVCVGGGGGVCVCVCVCVFLPPPPPIFSTFFNFHHSLESNTQIFLPAVVHQELICLLD